MTDGRSRSAAREAAQLVSRQLGQGADQLRRQAHGSTSDVFVGEAWVYIVARETTTAADVAARVAAATVLSRRAPFVRPAEDIDQPQLAAGRLVTVWHRVPTSAHPDWTAVGRAVRSLHEVDPGAVAATGLPLGAVDSLGDVTERLDRLAWTGLVPQGCLRVLRTAAARLESELAVLGGPLTLVHGDLHAANLLHPPGGAVLCDLDALAVGHPAYDLAFLIDPGRPTIPLDGPDRAAFSAGYGAELPEPQLARSLARSAHLRRTVALLASATRDPRVRYFDAARLGAWIGVLDEWDRDLLPIVTHSRARQLFWALRGTARGCNSGNPHRVADAVSHGASEDPSDRRGFRDGFRPS